MLDKNTKLLGYARVRMPNEEVESVKIMSDATGWLSDGRTIVIPPEEFTHYLRMLDFAIRDNNLTAAESNIMAPVEINEPDYVDEEDKKTQVATQHNTQPVRTRPVQQVSQTTTPQKVQHVQQKPAQKQHPQQYQQKQYKEEKSNTKGIILVSFGIILTLIGIFFAIQAINPSILMPSESDSINGIPESDIIYEPSSTLSGNPSQSVIPIDGGEFVITTPAE